MGKVIVAPLEALTDSSLTDPERRVLLSLYSWKGDSDYVWPSAAEIASRANIGDVTWVSKLTKKLEEKGWLEKKRRGYTGGMNYLLHVPERLENVAPLLESQSKLEPEPKLDQESNSKLDSGSKNNEQTIEQTILKKNKKTNSQKVFTDWLSEIRERGEKAIADDDPIVDYPNEIGMSEEFLRVAWHAFKTSYADKPKKYTDWRAVFRQYVRGNWGKLWWYDGTQYALTTVGHQARNELDSRHRQQATA
jgi:hypothetical protein